MEEGWFYKEPEFIAMFVLIKPMNFHVSDNGTFVQIRTKENTTAVNALITLTNEGKLQNHSR